MKKTLLSITTAFFLCIFSTTSFAQEAPGGSGDGITASTGTIAQPLGINFVRNNGDGILSQAEIRLYYGSAPTVAPVLKQIEYMGAPLYLNFIPVTGDLSTYASKGYVTFNLPTSNIPPAIKLTLTYSPSPSAQDAIISGTN